MEYQTPEYSMTFDDNQGQVMAASEADLNALTKKVLHSLNPAPVIDDLPDTYIKLPAGIITDKEVIQDAEVQELTGEHEEKLARARTSNNPAKYVNTLLQCGVVSIGDRPATPALLDSLLQGDLDMLIVGICIATFGSDFELVNIECPHCNELNDIGLNLKDIPVNKLADPSQREFLIDLRFGKKAKISFPDGNVQNEIFKEPRTIPEANTITLAHCLISLIDSEGNERLSNGMADVKKLGVKDRRTLEEFIYDNQPGPRYDEVTAQCSSCEGEVPVPLNVGILFREL